MIMMLLPLPGTGAQAHQLAERATVPGRAGQRRRPTIVQSPTDATSSQLSDGSATKSPRACVTRRNADRRLVHPTQLPVVVHRRIIRASLTLMAARSPPLPAPGAAAAYPGFRTFLVGAASTLGLAQLSPTKLHLRARVLPSCARWRAAIAASEKRRPSDARRTPRATHAV